MRNIEMNMQIKAKPAFSTAEEDSVEALWVGQNLHFFTQDMAVSSLGAPAL